MCGDGGLCVRGGGGKEEVVGTLKVKNLLPCGLTMRLTEYATAHAQTSMQSLGRAFDIRQDNISSFLDIFDQDSEVHMSSRSHFQSRHAQITRTRKQLYCNEVIQMICYLNWTKIFKG